jgi:hypothetical protein
MKQAEIFEPDHVGDFRRASWCHMSKTELFTIRFGSYRSNTSLNFKKLKLIFANYRIK